LPSAALVDASPRPRPGGASGTEAIGTARRLAAVGVVAPSAGNVAGQALTLGLVDVVAMDVVPVVFGSGKRFFGHVHAQHLLEDPDVVVQGDRALHLRYPVRRRSTGVRAQRRAHDHRPDAVLPVERLLQ
jgi:hypothetical protein